MTTSRRDELAQAHWDERERRFGKKIEDFSREVISVESWKLGYDARDAEIAELVAALELYASEKFYEGGHNTDGGHTGFEIDNYGETARAALAKHRGGEG